jgi:3-phosphoshikimate 1-carboxyvinyltransferase
MAEREVKPAGTLDAAVSVPGSRSLTNRALVCAALASGESQIDGWLDADDTRAMREGLGRLGVEVTERDGALVVKGLGGRFAIPLHPIDCGASGTTMRFLAACAARVAGRVVLDGTARMRERPIQELADALNRMGARASTVAGCPPLTVQGGTLHGGQIGIDASRSSQFLSALLLIAPMCPQDVELVTGDITSRFYVDMTLDVMNAFGVAVQMPHKHHFLIPAPQPYRPRRYRVEPDASSAMYFFAAAAITGGRIRLEGLTPASCQPDVRFVEVLERMGCSVERGSRSITVRGPRYLHGIDVDMNAMPDAALTLAVTACFAQGPTKIRNVANLRLKETDRMQALKNELEKLGAAVTITETDIEIAPPRERRGARIATYDDHRIAMSFAIAGLRTPGIVIENPDCVAKTFPDFFERLANLG